MQKAITKNQQNHRPTLLSFIQLRKQAQAFKTSHVHLNTSSLRFALKATLFNYQKFWPGPLNHTCLKGGTNSIMLCVQGIYTTSPYIYIIIAIIICKTLVVEQLVHIIGAVIKHFKHLRRTGYIFISKTTTLQHLYA